MSLKFVPEWANLQKVSTDLEKIFVPYRQHVITWTSVDTKIFDTIFFNSERVQICEMYP